jgi:hygromycin-B 7''-O-kinase
VASKSLFPEAASPEEFERLHRDDAVLLPGVHAILDRLGLKRSPIKRFEEGSLPVYAIGDDLVLKLYPPYDLAERDRESLVLQVLDGRISIPTPAVESVGDLDGWGYVLMTRLRGELLSAAWERIPGQSRMPLAAALGGALASLHAIRDPRLEPPLGGWERFIADQRRTCVERQRARGLDPEWLEQVPGFVERHPLNAANERTLLHTEVMREHLFVEKISDQWRLSGLFDFEPAMVGAPEYEFASVGLFFSAGDPALLRRTLVAYGYEPGELTNLLSRQLLAYALHHRYSNFAWYLRRLPPPAGVRTLEALSEHWWGVQ